MALTAPRLDDRRFQDIVDEAKKRIPHYCDEWTDHNVSDPGITFIELFAWMTEMLLYRVNRVPERHYIKFMEMMGIMLRGPVPAKTPVTFWLSAPSPTPVLIPAGTEVSSTQTETESPIVFTTHKDFVVVPPQLTAVLSEVATEQHGEKQLVSHNLRRLQTGYATADLFSPVPQVDDAFYFGFENDLSYHILSFEVDCDVAGGAGIDPAMPPYVWEASSNQTYMRWEQCDIEIDTSKGLNAPGYIELHLPKMDKFRLNNQNLYWVRVRIKEISSDERQDGMTPYEATPRLKQVAATAMGGTTLATHAELVANETMGRSNGEPGQIFHLQRAPVLDRRPNEHLVVRANGTVETWAEVKDFAESKAGDRHYTLDEVTGEVRFGPTIRQRDGSMRAYGAIPPRGANLVFARYRTGGGLQGNVEAGVLNTLKTAIPYIDQVLNKMPAKGGLDAESLQEAMMRVPLMMRSRDRAVTAADFEFLTRQALPAAVGRVKCFQPQSADGTQMAPGQVYVLVVPKVRYPEGYIAADELRLSAEDLQTLTAYLEERRLLTTRVNARMPGYRWAAVRVTAAPKPGVDAADAETAILKRLYRFLNPLTGGKDGRGWPFGRDLVDTEVSGALQDIPEVLFINKVELFVAAPNGQKVNADDPRTKIDVVSHGLVASGIHEVELMSDYGG